MDILLTQSSTNDLGKKIKKDPSWLNQERLNYIIENKPEVLSIISPSKIEPSLIEASFKNLKKLDKVLSVCEWLLNQKSKTYKSAVIEILSHLVIKTPEVLSSHVYHYPKLKSQPFNDIFLEAYEYIDSHNVDNKKKSKKKIL